MTEGQAAVLTIAMAMAPDISLFESWETNDTNGEVAVRFSFVIPDGRKIVGRIRPEGYGYVMFDEAGGDTCDWDEFTQYVEVPAGVLCTWPFKSGFNYELLLFNQRHTRELVNNDT